MSLAMASTGISYKYNVHNLGKSDVEPGMAAHAITQYLGGPGRGHVV